MSGAGANGGQNGAAESGVSHWWGQRLTAILLVPLALWFTASFVTLSGAGLVLVRQWIGAPVTSLFLAFLYGKGRTSSIMKGVSQTQAPVTQQTQGTAPVESKEKK